MSCLCACVCACVCVRVCVCVFPSVCLSVCGHVFWGNEGYLCAVDTNDAASLFLYSFNTYETQLMFRRNINVAWCFDSWLEIYPLVLRSVWWHPWWARGRQCDSCEGWTWCMTCTPFACCSMQFPTQGVASRGPYQTMTPWTRTLAPSPPIPGRRDTRLTLSLCVSLRLLLSLPISLLPLVSFAAPSDRNGDQ